MNLFDEYLNLTKQIIKSIQVPPVTAIHLPSMDVESEKADEFGFIFLQDGSVGPFYVSLDETLEKLWLLYPKGKSCEFDTVNLIENFNTDSEALHAIALGAFNALSQHVMKRADYSPLQAEQASSSGFNDLKKGETIGMVGYFKPLIEKLISRGIKVLVLEKNPQRVVINNEVSLSTNPADLAACQHILCTASTLINGTLTEILDALHATSRLSLIGPSGSGLPDILFNHGVDSVGGIYFDDNRVLLDALDKQESWGSAGQKYQLTKNSYPGINNLLSRISQGK